MSAQVRARHAEACLLKACADHIRGGASSAARVSAPFSRYPRSMRRTTTLLSNVELPSTSIRLG